MVEGENEEDGHSTVEEALDGNFEENDEKKYSEHDTASESEADDPQKRVIHSPNDASFVFGKDNITRWQLHCPNKISKGKKRSTKRCNTSFRIERQCKKCCVCICNYCILEKYFLQMKC